MRWTNDEECDKEDVFLSAIYRPSMHTGHQALRYPPAFILFLLTLCLNFLFFSQKNKQGNYKYYHSSFELFYKTLQTVMNGFVSILVYISQSLFDALPLPTNSLD